MFLQGRQVLKPGPSKAATSMSTHTGCTIDVISHHLTFALDLSAATLYGRPVASLMFLVQASLSHCFPSGLKAAINSLISVGCQLDSAPFCNMLRHFLIPCIVLIPTLRYSGQNEIRQSAGSVHSKKKKESR